MISLATDAIVTDTATQINKNPKILLISYLIDSVFLIQKKIIYGLSITYRKKYRCFYWFTNINIFYMYVLLGWVQNIYDFSYMRNSVSCLVLS